MIKLSEYIEDREDRRKIKMVCDMFHAQEVSITEKGKIILIFNPRELGANTKKI
jgi:hypothetical protein